MKERVSPAEVEISPARLIDEQSPGVILPSVMPAVAAPINDLGGRPLAEVIENYLHYYARGTGHTARAKQYDLGYLLDFLAAAKAGSSEEQRRSAVVVADWTMQATKDFVDRRLELGEAPSTVGRRLATIKHFGRTLAERVHGFINPAREVKSPSLQPNRPNGLTAVEISLLQEAARRLRERKKNSFNAVRNSFLLELLLATGLRADEVRLLTVNQISTDRSWLRNVKTKGRKFRNVYLQTEFRPFLQEYLEQRELQLSAKCPGWRELANKERLVFPVLISVARASIDRPGSFGLNPKTIWRIISDLGREAQALADEPLRNLHPHRLRHTFAHGLLDSSKDVRLVAQALGHSDVRTTMRYTERSEEQLARAIEEKASGSGRKPAHHSSRSSDSPPDTTIEP